MTSTSKRYKVDNVDIPQCVFDEIVLLILDTISSEEYLESVGIYRPPELNAYNWTRLLKHIGLQETNLIKPGLYARMFANGVHYYGVRKNKDGIIVIGNGYPHPRTSKKQPLSSSRSSGSLSGSELEEWGFKKHVKPYWYGLNAQANHSHGLCQTFALMFYNGDEHLLLKGRANYRKNIDIGFNYLLNFVSKNGRDRIWTVASLNKNMAPACEEEEYDILEYDCDEYCDTYKEHLATRKAVLTELKRRYKELSLSSLLANVVLNPIYKEKLDRWFFDDEE